MYKSPNQPFSLDVLLNSLFSAFPSVTAMKCLLADFLANDGDSVLLSPACSSFDMFSGYAERGEYFCELVKNLEKNEEVEE